MEPELKPELNWIDYGGREYREWVDLRQKVLRDPLGLKYSSEDLKEERDDKHLIVRFGDRPVVGGLILRLWNQDRAVAKMRQVAVAPDFQGLGLGQLLVREFERVAREMNISEIVLHSRLAVREFYEKLGYATEGDIFTEVGLPHLRMRKTLRKSGAAD